MQNIEMYRRNLQLLQGAQVPYREFEHEPLLNYQKAAEIRARFGLSSTESKNLFIKLKPAGYCMFMSLEGRRLDFKQAKKLLGSRPALCSDEELQQQTGCLPGCACPFGLRKDIRLLVDRAIFAAERFIFSPGVAEKSIEIHGADIPKLLAALPNEITWYEPGEIECAAVLGS